MSHFPELEFDAWTPTRETLHRFLQVVGKVRLAESPRRNHWWNVPFHLTGSGITSRPMGQSPVFAIDFDFIDHRLVIATDGDQRRSFSLKGISVASFHDHLTRTMRDVGADPWPIRDARPFDLPDSHRRFADDHEHATYDPGAVRDYWHTLSRVNLLLEEFCGRFSGKTSAVHHFWHTFDIAATRFSDVVVPHGTDTDAVTREAYSREVISFGFWFGDQRLPEPAFYSYTAPEPGGIREHPLTDGAHWVERGSSHLAVLPMRVTNRAEDPRRVVLDFYESAYRAGAEAAGWDVGRFECPEGATDPLFALSSWA
jgi:hypothetical protein